MHSRYGFIPSRFPKDLCRAMCICVKLCMVWLCQTWFGKHFGSEFSEFSSLWGCCWGSVESRVGSSFQVTCICFKWELNKTIFPIPKKKCFCIFWCFIHGTKNEIFKKIHSRHCPFDAFWKATMAFELTYRSTFIDTIELEPAEKLKRSQSLPALTIPLAAEEIQNREPWDEWKNPAWCIHLYPFETKFVG